MLLDVGLTYLMWLMSLTMICLGILKCTRIVLGVLVVQERRVWPQPSLLFMTLMSFMTSNRCSFKVIVLFHLNWQGTKLQNSSLDLFPIDRLGEMTLYLRISHLLWS